jgi:hypothetical protein
MMSGLTDDPNVPHAQGPADEEPTPQAATYLVLPAGDRARGFVRPLRTSYQHVTCGQVTTMALPLAETYAVNPRFYSGTYCVGCRKHRPVAEFRWQPDGQVVGT